MRRAMPFPVAAVFSLLLQVAPLAAQGVNSASFVKVTATADKVGAAGKQVVTVTLTIDDKWQVYANPLGNADLDGCQTTLTINAKVRPKSVRFEYPAPTVIEDRFVGNYNVYRKKAVIKAFVERAPGDTSPLQVAVWFRSTNVRGTLCVRPSTVRLTVP